MTTYVHVSGTGTVYHQKDGWCSYKAERHLTDGTGGLERLCAECAMAMLQKELQQALAFAESVQQREILFAHVATDLHAHIERLRTILIQSHPHLEDD